MKCPECGAEIYEDAKKCPFCKTPMIKNKDKRLDKCDIQYTITSREQIKLIRDSVNEVAENMAKDEKGEKDMTVKKYVRISRDAGEGRGGRKHGRKSRRDKEKRKPSRDTLLRIGAASASIVLVLAVVAAVCAVVGAISKRNPEAAAYTYIKENSLYLIYNGKSCELTQSAISESYLRRSEDKSLPENAATVAAASQIAKNASNGRLTYFFENFDPDTASGDLFVIENGKTKKKHKISEAVHNSIVVSEDGERILYLQSTDKNGDMGVLYYYELGMDEPYKISTDIDSETFTLSHDADEAIFLQNLDRVAMKGDLYMKNLKKLKDEKVKIDSEVCKVFGTMKDGAYLYGKEFSTEDSTFELRLADGGERSLRLGDRTCLAPYVPKKGHFLFCYGAADDGTNNLYRVDTRNGKKEKIASGVNRIYGMTKNGKTVIYDKVFDNKASDCYAYTAGKQPQKLAGSISVDYGAVGTAQQFAVSPDLSLIAYISDFDKTKGGGTLYTAKMKGGRVTEAEQIAEDVFSCGILDDGKVVFTKDYSASCGVLDVYLLSGKKTVLLKDEVLPELFDFESFGRNIFYVTDYNISGDFGALMRMDFRGKSVEIAQGVHSFELCENGDALLFKNFDDESGNADLYLLKAGKTEPTVIERAVGGIVER